MTVNLSALAGAGQQFFDNNGVILSGGKLYSYAAGTTTPQATYTSVSGGTAHTNPIILDSAGRVATGEIWVTAGQNYKFVLKTSTEVTLATWDNITGINGTGIATAAVNVSFTGFEGQTGTVQDLADDNGSDWIGFEPAGSGAVARSAQDKMRETVSVKDFGAVGDGVTDDTTALQNAINYASSIGANLSLVNLNIGIGSQITGLSNLRIVGGGANAKITQLGTSTFTPILFNSKTNIVLDGFTLACNNTTAGTAYGISLISCTEFNVLNVKIDNANNVAFYAEDCDRGLVDGVYATCTDLVRYAADAAAYAVSLAGCTGVTVTNSTGFQVHFGFVIQKSTARSEAQSSGNRITNSYVEKHTGHAFDIFEADGNSIIGCTAKTYQGTVTPRGSFQIKHGSTESSLGNQITDCTAIDIDIGFISQDGSRAIFSNLTAVNPKFGGLFLNSTPYSQVNNIVVQNFGTSATGLLQGYAVRLASNSDGTIVNNVTSSSGNVLNTYAILLEGSDACSISNVYLKNTHDYGLYIDATSDNTILANTVRLGSVLFTTNALTDLGANTIYPLSFGAVADITSTGRVQFSNQPQQGMFVGNVTFVTLLAITGSPTISVGSLTNLSLLATAQAPSASQNGVVLAILASQDLGTAAHLCANVVVAGSAGSVFVQVNGLPRL